MATATPRARLRQQCLGWQTAPAWWLADLWRGAAGTLQAAEGRAETLELVGGGKTKGTSVRSGLARKH